MIIHPSAWTKHSEGVAPEFPYTTNAGIPTLRDGKANLNMIPKENMRPFLTKLFGELQAKYPIYTSKYTVGKNKNYQQVGSWDVGFGKDPVYVSFQLEPTVGPLRLEYTLQKGGADGLSVLQKREIEIKKILGHGDGQNVVFDPVSSADRAKFLLNYAGSDSSEEALISWAVSMYGKFTDVLKKYAN